MLFSDHDRNLLRQQPKAPSVCSLFPKLACDTICMIHVHVHACLDVYTDGIHVLSVHLSTRLKRAWSFVAACLV